MIKLYHAPMTRSMRIYWLLEELGDVPYQLERVQFAPPKQPFSQATPLGKVPVLEDGEVLMFESGAILEFILERYGKGRLAPAQGTPPRAAYLQWVHFSEATLFPPLGDIVRHTIFKPEGERVPAVVEDARARARVTLGVLERALERKQFLLGAEFSGADVMMGFTLLAAKRLGVLDADFPAVSEYLGRLESRPALQKALG
jgi:glutathione S-transferase